jgi:ubiquinone/menaquinone biosynthesis C-methylase UbiE
MSQPKGYVDSDYLRLVGESVRHLKNRTYELLDLTPGKVALDVGCGPASDTIELGRLVGQQGRVFGADHDMAMLKDADARAGQAGVSAWVRHLRADSAALPFASDTFDAARSERLFQHLPDPRGTLAEMLRVTKSGGRVLVLDTDWGSNSTDTSEVDIERRLARAHADRAAHNGYAGRQLYRLFRQAGLQDVAVEVYVNWSTDYAFVRRATLLDEVERISVAEGLVTPEEVRRLREQLERADAEGTFFSSANQVLVVGKKP